MKKLIDSSEPGDIIYLQYSGHGQQIQDDNDDEFDGMDEALAPYGAPEQPDAGYTGALHVRDDQVGEWLTALRQKVGAQGNVVMVVDSCFSGTISRGKEARPARTTPRPIGTPKQNASRALLDKEGGGLDTANDAANQTLAPHVVFSAARQFEPAQEVHDHNNESVGALTLALSEEFERIQEAASYRDLFRSVRNHMARTVPRQRPLIEGDIDTEVFSGDVVPQTAFYTVDFAKGTKAELLGGHIAGLATGTKVELHPAGSKGPSKTTAVATGSITRAKAFSADVELDTPVKDVKAEDLWAFVTQQTFPGLQVQVHLDESVTGETREALQGKLNALGTAQAVDSLDASDVLISMVGTELKLMDRSSSTTMTTAPATDISSVTDRLKKHTRARFMRGMDLRDPNVNIEISLTSCEGSSEPVGNQVKVDDTFALKIKNTGEWSAFVTVLWVSQDDSITQLIPKDIHAKDNELAAGGEKTFPNKGKGCLQSSPPAGQELVKVFATDQPVDFSPIITPVRTRGAAPKLHPLAALLSDSDIRTRSAGVMSGGAQVQSVIIDVVE
jgi:hypothetical protein